MKKIFLLSIMITLLASCIEREKTITETVYVVNSKTANVRSEPSLKAGIISKLHRNDTIRGEVQGKWLQISDSAAAKFVFLSNLEARQIHYRVNVFEGNKTQQAIDHFLLDVLTIKKATFWIALIGFPLLAFILIVSVSFPFEKKIAIKHLGNDESAVNLLPLLVGIMMAIVSVIMFFYYIPSIIAITNISFLPLGKGPIDWGITIIAYLLAISFIYNLISGIVKYGFTDGILRFVLVVISSLTTACAAFILSWTFIVIAILVIALGLLAIILGGMKSQGKKEEGKRDIYKEAAVRWEKQRNAEIKKNAEREFFERNQRKYRE